MEGLWLALGMLAMEEGEEERSIEINRKIDKMQEQLDRVEQKINILGLVEYKKMVRKLKKQVREDF